VVPDRTDPGTEKFRLKSTYPESAFDFF